MDVVKTRWGQLEGLEIAEKKDSSSEDFGIVVLHGYGASDTDLAPISRFAGFPSPCRWYFPNAPLEVPLGMGMTGRGWFPLDMNAFERAMQTGVPVDFSEDVPAGFLEASEKVQGLLGSLAEIHKKLFVGGFSQGGMVALDAVLAGEKTPAGAFVLSSSLVARSRWEERLSVHSQLPVFQSHGNQDGVLHPQGARKLRDLLERKEIPLEYHEFSGGHELPNQILSSLADFVQRHSR